MMLSKGSYINSNNDKINIFNSSTVDKFTTKVTNVPYPNSRALGWDTVPISTTKACGDYFSPNSFGHTGFTGTSIYADKEKDLAVILLTNRVYPFRNRTADPIRYFRVAAMNLICEVMGYVNDF